MEVQYDVPSRLVLIRHAKAEAGGSSDRERRLSSRGEADARALGRWLDEQGLRPDRVAVSPARRARQTWELAAESQDWPRPVIEDAIYDNTVPGLLEVIRASPADVRTLALVGHNPSMGALAEALDGTRAHDFPTSAVAVFTVAEDWAAIDAATSTPVGFDVPRG
ncbi:MAG: phosphohistidine phosphatase [Frankiaceae bacterium]|nr:phosphohistidine phosphatase [Frankiaceae bacterium]